MIREIIYDKFFLQQKSAEASIEDMDIVRDLKDTLKHHQNSCVGMAANMIGYQKRILVMNQNGLFVFINPVIIEKNKEYITEEGCLCHKGLRKTKRYGKIKIKYYNELFKVKIKTFYDFEAQIIQHEMDHFEGILI